MKAARAWLLMLLVLVLPVRGAWAHGDEGHAARHVFDAAQVEATPFGEEGNPAHVTRTVRVEMNDQMRFVPGRIAVKKGETIRFVIANQGAVLHEMVLGTADALARHAELMKRFPNMEHADPNMAHVQPGGSGEIVWKFTQAGEFEFACLQPGHFEAGMIGKVVVK